MIQGKYGVAKWSTTYFSINFRRSDFSIFDILSNPSLIWTKVYIYIYIYEQNPQTILPYAASIKTQFSWALFFRLFNYHRYCIGKVNFGYRQMTKLQMSRPKNVQADLLEIIPWPRKKTDLASWLALSLLPLGQGQGKTLDCPWFQYCDFSFNFYSTRPFISL